MNVDNRVQRVVQAVRAIDDAQSLTQALDALVAGAGVETSHAGVLLIRSDSARRWRDDAAIDLPLAGTGIVADAVRTRRATSTTVVDAAPPPFADAPAASTVRAFPLSLAGDVVAVLCAEGGDAGALEILARHAARVLEVLTAFKAARVVAGASSQAAGSVADLPAPGDDEEAARLAAGDASILMDVSAA
jgi:hypothetical protein